MKPLQIFYTRFVLLCCLQGNALAQPSDRGTKPSTGEWIQGRDPHQKLNLISWLVDGCFYYPGPTPSPMGVKPCNFTVAPDQSDPPPEYASFDGFYNNVFNTQLGAVDTPLLRRLPPVYADGTYEPVKGRRINPLTASQRLMTRSAACVDSKNRTVACGSKTGKSAFLVFFGQQVVEEILDAQRPGCPPEYFNVPVPEGHEFRTNHSVMPLLRSRYAAWTGSGPGNPRQQLNEITACFDGGLIYGTAKGWADVLRTFPNGSLHPEGKLASHEGKGYFPVRNTLRLPLANPPPPAFHSRWKAEGETARVDRFFVLGNPRGNENAFLLAFGVVLFRWHNHFAEYLHVTRPAWSGERVFQEARKWATATYNSIVYYDWLIQWLGEELEPYRGYDPALDPQIEQFFKTAAMLFGHTLVTPGAYLRDYACTGCKRLAFYGLGPPASPAEQDPGRGAGEGAVRTCNIFWRPQEPLEMPHNPPPCMAPDDDRSFADIDRLLMGMASQRAEQEDNMIVEDLRGRVFGPLEFPRRDLMAVNIQRGRDHGTPDYNSAREAFGLKRISSVEEYIRLTGTATPRDILVTMEEIHSEEGSSNNSTSAWDGEEGGSSAWDNIDVWTGGILETSDRPGPLFRAILKDQFTRIRNADRFWFENENWARPRFQPDQIARIKSLTVFDMVVSVTRMNASDLQPNPFRVPDDSKNRLSCLHPPNRAELHEPNLWQNGTCNQTMYDTQGNLIQSATVMATCFFLLQLDSEQNPVEPCTPPATYDYFSRSEVPFILTYTLLALFVTALPALGLPGIISWLRRRQAAEATVQTLATEIEGAPEMRFTTLQHQLAGVSLISAREWLSESEADERAVALAVRARKLEVRSLSGELLREVRLAAAVEVILAAAGGGSSWLVIKNPAEADVVLKFEGPLFLQQFLHQLGTQSNVRRSSVRNFADLAGQLVTKAHRLVQLNQFFRAVFANEGMPKSSFDAANVHLSPAEFAAALGVDSSSEVVMRMFDVADIDGDGQLSFLEFFSILSIFRKGSSEGRLAYIFRLYDRDGSGRLSREQFGVMLRSVLTLLAEDQDPEPLLARLRPAIDAELGQKEYVIESDFQRIISRDRSQFGGMDEGPVQGKGTGKSGKRVSYIESTRASVFQLFESSQGGEGDDGELEVETQAAGAAPTSGRRAWFLVWFEIHRLQIFWLSLFNLLTAAIFAERSYVYSVESEHRGFRQIAGAGVSVTRGAASVQMWCYALLLLSMCRNLLTRVRESRALARLIPFDSAVAFHKYVALVGLVFTILHVVGHSVNFYNISTQSAEDVSCIFRDYFRPTHVLPTFQYWAFQTVTGLSGMMLVIHATLIFTFATPLARQYAYRLFWLTHQSYPLWYALLLLHGSGQLVQAPLFLNFLIGPLVLFVGDKLVTITRQLTEIPVLAADLLPNNVIRFKFVRPTDFEYKSGQWIRIACTALNRSEFHPFTLTSAPHEPTLSLHIRAVGPFTHNLRRTYETSLPSLYIDGPYGETHQDWGRFEVSILVGGGIGVTPFASILKELGSGRVATLAKKVYFIWVTRSQRQFEWLVDIIREAEVSTLVSAHIFITGQNAGFDLRTLLLYAFEREFQRVNGRSLLTGLKASTHFGRPDFTAFLRSVRSRHENVSKFGVFVCGPAPMTKSVDEACQQINTEKLNLGGAEFRCHTDMF